MAIDQLYTDALKELEQVKAARDEYRNHLETICEMTGQGSDIGAAHEAVNALIEERDQYRAAEEAQIALRQKMQQERDSLQRLADNRAEQRDSLAAHMNRITGLVLDLDECEQDSEEMGIAWDTLNSAIQEPATTSLARRDADLLAQPFKNISGCSDHSCLIRKPEGMGTNGGCRCHTDRSKASIIIQRLATLRDKAVGGL